VIEDFNALAETAAVEALHTCCSSSRWAAEVAARRPYADLDELVTASDETFELLTDADVVEALAGHPRIGDRNPGSSRAAHWSRSEQSAVMDAPDDVQAAIVAGNHAYEERFGHVFLIRATGRSPEQMLAALNDRLGNDPDTERAEVREQLRQITALRLEKLVGG
jgi:2-oxo-4-hydroxy-4-carboxy-5-ureidoimidazoline decarboxylase